jgi:glutamate synthase domain-containing protein 3
LDYNALNRAIQSARDDCEITGCLGQRFIGAGMRERHLLIRGVPGNALGAYLNGAEITVHGNAQDAVGDTMNAGIITVHGNIGDAAGYAMRGGMILIMGSAGYRAGIHMKAYHEKQPVLVIGGKAGSFLGEYQAGGIIIVLGLHGDGTDIVGGFPSTGMYGGKLFLRSDCSNIIFPEQVTTRAATQEDLEGILAYISLFCGLFGEDLASVMNAPFTLVTPNSRNPYRQTYVTN